MQPITYANVLLLLHLALEHPILALVVFVNVEHQLHAQAQAIHVQVVFVSAGHLRLVQCQVKPALVVNANVGHHHPALA